MRTWFLIMALSAFGAGWSIGGLAMAGQPMVSEHKYSLSEIDRMRDALRSIHDPYASMCPGVSYHTYGSIAEQEATYSRTVEDSLRTYMMNGTTPEELEQKVKELWAQLA